MFEENTNETIDLLWEKLLRQQLIKQNSILKNKMKTFIDIDKT